MNKSEFLEKLSAQLRRRNIADAEDIMEEYRQHFTFKLAEGHTEEEIAAKLGEPESIAAQYDAVVLKGKGGHRAAALVGLGIADFGFGLLCLLLYSIGLTLGCFVLSFGLLSLGLIFDLGRLEYFTMPEMPYHCALVFGLAFAALTWLAGVGTAAFFRLISRLIRSFRRFHRGVLLPSPDKSGKDSPAVCPDSPVKSRPRLRRACIIAAVIFALCLAAGFILCVASSGHIEFWHAWGWFGYGA